MNVSRWLSDKSATPPMQLCGLGSRHKARTMQECTRGKLIWHPLAWCRKPLSAAVCRWDSHSVAEPSMVCAILAVTFLQLVNKAGAMLEASSTPRSRLHCVATDCFGTGPAVCCYCSKSMRPGIRLVHASCTRARPPAVQVRVETTSRSECKRRERSAFASRFAIAARSHLVGLAIASLKGRWRWPTIEAFR